MSKLRAKKKSVRLPQVLVIAGPTSSGKTVLAVVLAREFEGEIISADSRQVYKGMDLGTGKDLAEYGRGKHAVKHHLIDVVSPKRRFDLAKYQNLANQAIEKALSSQRLPILAGGSGLYLQALADNYRLPEAKPDEKLRRQREKLPAEELFCFIAKLKPAFAKKINESDRHNQRRLIRYLEVLEAGAKRKRPPSPRYDCLILALDVSDEILRERINQRLEERLAAGLVGEVESLLESGVTAKRLRSFGLEYRFVSAYLANELEYEEMKEKLATAIYRFAKRQKSWLRRWQKQGAKINWIKDKKEATALIKKWYK